MNIENNTVLVTGGSTGIGFALAARFLAAGSRVIICGRREQALAEARSAHPGLQTIQCDISREEERVRLFQTVAREYPRLNVLVNNAGIQNRPPPLTQHQDWSSHAHEISTNLEAAMHLTMLFVPFLMAQKDPAIINVTSGLAFVPMAMMPTYCATKAALHSFTMSTRRQLADTPIKVVEIAPPAVQTDLGGKGLHDFGVPLDEFADYAMDQLRVGKEEFGYQFSEKGMDASGPEIQQMFEAMNAPRA